MGNQKRGGAFQEIVRALFTVAFISSAVSSQAQHGQASLGGASADDLVNGADARFKSIQDLRQLQSQKHSLSYSFQQVYAAEGLVESTSFVWARNQDATRELSEQVSHAVDLLGCKNFSEAVVAIGSNLRNGLGSLGNSSQEAKMLFYSEVRNALKMRFSDAAGERIRERMEEAFLLTLDSAATLDASNPKSKDFVAQIAANLQSQYEDHLGENGLSERYGCGVKVDSSAIVNSAGASPNTEVAQHVVEQKNAAPESKKSESRTKERTHKVSLDTQSGIGVKIAPIENKPKDTAVKLPAIIAPAPVPVPEPTPTPPPRTQADVDKELIAKFSALGVPKTVLSEAFAARAKHRATGKISNEKQMVVMDLTRKTSQKRFWVLDLETGKVSKSFFVAHGSGNGVAKGVTNPQTEVAYLSNDVGSNASTWGSMLIKGADKNSGQPNATALEGLDSHNKNMGNGGDDMRKIKIHSANYFTGKKNNSDAPPINSGRSSGCPVLYPQDAIWVRSQIPSGTFMYAYKGDIPVISKGNSTAARRAIASR